MEEVVKFDEIAGCKILIVDDVAVLRTLIKTCLQKAGYLNLHTAESGDDALAMLDELNPDLIILDIVMPGTDGFEVCRQIRKNTDHSKAEFDRRQKVPFWNNSEVYLATPEDVLIKKLSFYREGGSEKHLKDIRSL